MELASDTILSMAYNLLALAKILGIALCRFVGGVVCSNDYCGILGTCLGGLVTYYVGDGVAISCAKAVFCFLYTIPIR